MCVVGWGVGWKRGGWRAQLHAGKMYDVSESLLQPQCVATVALFLYGGAPAGVPPLPASLRIKNNATRSPERCKYYWLREKFITGDEMAVIVFCFTFSVYFSSGDTILLRGILGMSRILVGFIKISFDLLSFPFFFFNILYYGV